MVASRSVTYVNRDTPLVLSTKEVDLDTCYKPDEIVVDVHAAALNPVDMVVYGLTHPWIAGSSDKTIGKDYSGVIVRVGSKVTGWKVGEKVNGQYAAIFDTRGSFSDYLVLNPSSQCAIGHVPQIPASVSNGQNPFVVSAAWPLVFGTAYTMLYNYGQKLSKDSKILVIGASTSVGTSLVQIAKKELHVGTIVGICSSAARKHNEEEFGYDYTVAYNDPSKPVVDTVQSLIKNELNGEKFDLIADCVGNNQFFPVIDTVLKPKSQNSYYLTIVGDKKANFKSPSLGAFFTIWSLIRPFNPLRKYNYALTFLKPQREYMALGEKMIKEGQFKPVIDSVYEFDQFQAAVDRLTTNKAKGKVVVKVKDE